MDQNTFTYEARERTVIIHMPKELDHHNCRNLKSDTDILLGENMIDRIIFDFTRTAFMDSSGIGVLLGRYKEMRAAGGRVSYYGAGKQVKRILEISGINRLVSGYEKKEQALKSER